ncbi:M1 family aminopeptidase [Paraglaciecola sp.]|uniref:M1 family aminopeptidase n=1 Tax=Paraglaciecola sp. TaxID=1920173 RepID=UPI003EF536A0
MLINEWRYLYRQPLTWLACFVLPFMAFIFALGIGGIDTIADKRLQALHMTLVMMSLPLLCGALAPLTFLRDQVNDMEELILVTPLSLIKRLLVRTGVLITFCATLMCVSFVIMWIVLSQSFGFSLKLLILTFWDVVFIALPACTFFCALACLVSQRFASSVIIYVIFCVIWLGYIVLASLTGSPMLAGSSMSHPWLFSIMRILDPFGNTAIIALYKTVEPTLFGDLIFYANRLIYCGLTAACFYWALLVKPKARKPLPLIKESSLQNAHKTQYQAVSVNSNTWSQLKSLTVLASKAIFKQKVNQLLMLGWGILIFNEILSGIDYAEPLAVLLPTSLDALNRVSYDVLPLLGSFIVLLWSWQLCWHNRHTAMAELISASPVRSGTLMMSHYLALVSMILVLVFVSAVAGMSAELFANSQIQLFQYVWQLSTVGLSLILLAAVFVALHTICRSQLVAVAWCITLLIFKNTPISGYLGLTHTFWNIASSPLQPADMFWGLEKSDSVYWPYMSFWLAVSVCCLWFAGKWSHRTTSFVNAQRWNISVISAIFLLVTIFSGLNLHHNLITERPLISSDLREKWRADYEKKYWHWESVVQPTVSHVDAQVDIFPEHGKAKFALTYTLENRSIENVKQLLIGNYSVTAIEQLDFSKKYSQVFDQELGQYVVSLEQPLAPGEVFTMSFVLNYTQPEYWPAVGSQIVKPSFSYIRAVPMLPSVGFQRNLTLRGELVRQRFDLKPLNIPAPSRLFSTPNTVTSRYEWASVSSIISTSANQLPLAQGDIVKQWTENGRRYAHFETKEPIRNAFVWLSVGNHVLVNEQENVEFSIYSSESNAAAEVNMLAMQNTVSWMSTNIAPYRGTRLSLIATPDIGGTGYALPQMMLINHKVGFRAQPAKNAGFDQRYRRAVHETAHQWFGHDLGNGVLTDNAFLVESLAKYIELVMIENDYGEAAMKALVEYERQRYSDALVRNTQKIKALVDATDSFDMYSRATLVFAILRDKIGDQVITQSLRILWQQHAYPKTPATSMDFVRILKTQVKNEHQPLVDELLLGTDTELLL